MTYHVHNADVMEWAKRYEGEPFHAILCDPPYGLNDQDIDMVAVLTAWLAGKEYTPRGKGFMQAAWDAFVPGPSYWRALRAICYPGAYLMAAGGTRTADLLAMALRLAGWEKVDEIHWAYGSGFPKSHNISAAIDKAAGAEREIVGTSKGAGSSDTYALGRFASRFPMTLPATGMAKVWDGFGTALKPAHEPILIFRNPLCTTYAENCVRTGAGALNIDKGRIETDDNLNGGTYSQGASNGTVYGGGIVKPANRDYVQPFGRWPSNLILGHSAACTEHGCAGDCAVEAMGRQSGVTKSSADPDRFENTRKFTGKVYASDEYTLNMQGGKVAVYNDEGTAARFFMQTDWALEQHDPFFYCAKSSTAEREAGLDGFTPATTDDGRTTPIDNPYLRGETTRRNTHPTVKPLALTKYLAGLLLPPDMYAPRRLLVPFCGSGSECIGGLLAGWDEVHGIELSAEYCAIAEARLAYWSQRRHLMSVRLQHVKKPVTQEQASLFDALQF